MIAEMEAIAGIRLVGLYINWVDHLFLGISQISN